MTAPPEDARDTFDAELAGQLADALGEEVHSGDFREAQRTGRPVFNGPISHSQCPDCTAAMLAEQQEVRNRPGQRLKRARDRLTPEQAAAALRGALAVERNARNRALGVLRGRRKRKPQQGGPMPGTEGLDAAIAGTVGQAPASREDQIAGLERQVADLERDLQESQALGDHASETRQAEELKRVRSRLAQLQAEAS